MSDVSGIAYFAALGFLFVIFCAFIDGLVNRLRNRKKQPKTSVNKPIIHEKSEEDREYNTTYGEDDWEQEDDEFHEEVY
jgi:hypothetical protein